MKLYLYDTVFLWEYLSKSPNIYTSENLIQTVQNLRL